MDYKTYIYCGQTKFQKGKSETEFTKQFEKLAPWYQKRIGKFLPKHSSADILDCPCGYGNFLYFLQKCGYSQVLGVDLDIGRVSIAKRLGLNAQTADASTFLKNKNNLYDLITSLDFLEHLTKEKLIEYLDLCFSALKTNGCIILRAPSCDGLFGARDRYNDLTHETGFTSLVAEGLLRMVGFREVAILDERPQPYKLVNYFRLFAYITFTYTSNILLKFIGLGAPRVWTTSMWIIGKK
jgi:2-polyprenyl-3-methyl-5-hydroxy-6-metoxy-1,4-benzoquinol methylase